MPRGNEAILKSNSRRDPITDENPRRAAMQASKSLESSSRTWFSTGINSGILTFDMMVMASRKSILDNTIKFEKPSYQGWWALRDEMQIWILRGHHYARRDLLDKWYGCDRYRNESKGLMNRPRRTLRQSRRVPPNRITRDAGFGKNTL